MRRAFASSLLSLLLLISVVWGGCISCEQYFMFGGAKSCCTPNGHCKTTRPSQNSDRECKQIAFDHHKSVSLHIDPPIVEVVKIELPAPTVEGLEHWRGGSRVDPSPPDLQILHSTFLI